MSHCWQIVLFRLWLFIPPVLKRMSLNSNTMRNKFKSTVNLSLKNGYSNEELHNMLDSLSFLSDNEKQVLSAKIKLYIGFIDVYAENEAIRFVTDILNGTHPIIQLKH